MEIVLEVIYSNIIIFIKMKSLNVMFRLKLDKEYVVYV